MTTNPQTGYIATIGERAVEVRWPDNDRGGATPPPEGWQERAWEQRTLHEIDEGSVTGCSVLRWRDDPRSDDELIALSLALVTGQPPAVSVPAPAPTDQAAARYRAAWHSARSRAQAYYEGILRVVGDRESYQGWLRQAETASEAQRLALSQALGLGTSAPWDAIRDRAAELAAAASGSGRVADDGCTCADAGDGFAPAGHYADCPQSAPAVVSQPDEEA